MKYALHTAAALLSAFLAPARLIQTAHGHRTSEVVSICYPQVVNNLVSRALNAAAQVGFPKVDAQVIAGC